MSAGLGLGIGILSWGAPLTLGKTLRSYHRMGLFECADQVVLFCNEIGPLDRAIARHFELECIGSAENIGIGRAIAQLTARLQTEYFLFLENDWELIEDSVVTRRRLEVAVGMLRAQKADVARFRHRVHHGEPLITRPFMGRELQASAFLLEAAYWMEDPAHAFPEQIAKESIAGEDWFFTSARHATYTNNPCLYRTSFVREVILPHAEGEGILIEKNIEDWWREQESFRICQGPGLFMHSRIDRHHVGLRWLRTLVGAVAKRFGIRRPGRLPVPFDIGGPWRSDL